MLKNQAFFALVFLFLNLLFFNFLFLINTGPVSAITITGITNTPDPFTPGSTNFGVTVSGGPGDVHAAIYDSSNNLVRRFYSNNMNNGTTNLTWNGRDDSGAALPAGTYSVRFKAGMDLQYSRKIQGTGDFFAHPFDSCMDANQNVYVVDTYNSCIHKYNSEGNLVWRKGSMGTTGSVGGEPSLTDPRGICTDGTYLYVTDTGNCRVQRLDLDGYIVTPTWYNHSGYDGESADPMTRLMGMDYDNGWVYIAVDVGGYTDWWGGVQPSEDVYMMRLRTSDVNRQVSRSAALGDIDEKDGVADICVIPGDDRVIMSSPTNVMIWGGRSGVRVDLSRFTTRNLQNFGRTDRIWYGLSKYSRGATDYLLACNIEDDEIQRYEVGGGAGTDADTNGWPFGTPGDGNGQLVTPCGVTAFDDGSNVSVWVVDTGNNRLQKFVNNGTTTSYERKVQNDTMTVSRPTDIAIDNSGNVYVAASGDNRIVKFDQYGAFLMKIGKFGPRQDNTLWDRFDRPQGVAVDENGLVYISDTYNERIVRFNAAGTAPAAGLGDWVTGLIDLDGWWAGTQWHQNDWPYGMDFAMVGTTPYLVWFHSMDFEAGIGWVRTDTGTNRNHTNASMPEWQGRGLDAALTREIDWLIGTTNNKDPDSWGAHTGLHYFRPETVAATGDLLGTGDQDVAGISMDIWDNAFVCRTDLNRIEVYRFFDTDYPGITVAPRVLFETEGSFGTGNGQFRFPSGIAISPDGTFCWVSDYFNNRIQRFNIVYDWEGTETVTIEAPGPPTVNNAFISGSNVNFYENYTPTEYFARQGTGTLVEIFFSTSMQTSTAITVSVQAADGFEIPVTAVSAAGYTNGFLDTATNTWHGNIDIPTGHDGIARLIVRGGVSAAVLAQDPDPWTDFSFTIDTVAPSAPVIDQPPSPTMEEVTNVTGTAEANGFVDVYNYTLAAGGTLISSQLGINVDTLAGWYASAMDLTTVDPGENWFEAQCTDRAGNVSPFSPMRKLVFFAEKDPGQALVTPTDNVKVGDFGQWTFRYVAAYDMTDGTVVIRVPPGWSLPNETPGVAGYCTISASTGMVLDTTPAGDDLRINPGGNLTDRDIVVSFDSAIAGSYFDVTYGASNPPGAQIEAGATLGNNLFIFSSTDTDAAHTKPWTDPTGMWPINDPHIYVYGESVELAFTDLLNGVGTITQGISALETMSLTFTNYNIGADDKILNLLLNIEDSLGAAIADPSQYITKVTVKDAGTNYTINTNIPTSGGQILADFSSNFLTVPAGASRTIKVLVDISPTAPAGQTLRLSLDSAASILAKDYSSDLNIGVSVKAPESFPLDTSHVTIANASASTDLRILHTDTMPDNVSKGATGIQPFQLKFTNNDAGSYDVKITKLVIRMERADSTGIIPSSIINAFSLERADGTGTYLVDNTIETSGNTITLDLVVNPIIVPYGTPQQVNFKVNISPLASHTDFRINLVSAADVTALDTVSGVAIGGSPGIHEDPADLAGPGPDSGGPGFNDMPSDGAGVQEPAQAIVDSVTIAGNPAVIYTGLAYEVKLNVTAAAGRANVFYEPSVDDLKIMIAGVNKTGEFTITPLSGNLSIAAGTSTEISYQIVQNIGTSTGAVIIDTPNTGDGDLQNYPKFWDWNDHIDSSRLSAADVDGAGVPWSGMCMAPEILVSFDTCGNNIRAANENRIETVRISITNNKPLGAAAVFTDIALINKGTALDSEIASVNLYTDTDNNGDAAGETSLGSAVFASGEANINLGAGISIANGATVHYIATFDAAAVIRDGVTLDCAVKQASMIFDSGSVTLPGFEASPAGFDTIDIIADRIVCYPTGTAATNGFYTLNVETQDSLGNVDTSPVTSNVTINLTKSGGGNPVVTSSSLSGGTTGSNTINGNIVNGASTITVSDNAAEIVTVTPVSTYSTNTPCTITFANVFTVAPQAVTGGGFAPGSTDIEVLWLSMNNSSGSAVTLNSLVLNNTGTAADSEIAAVSVYRDTNSDGVIDGGDTPLGTGTFSAGSVTINLGNHSVPIGNHYLLIGFDILSYPVIDNNTLNTAIPANGLTYNTSATAPATSATSSGLCYIKVTAEKIVVTADDGTASILDTETLTIEARDGFNNIDRDYGETVSITCTGNSGNHGTIQSTTLVPGPTGTQLTSGTLTNGQALVVITDDIAETVTVQPGSPFSAANNISDDVVFSGTGPVLLSATPVDSTHIRLAFDTTVSASEANTASNYVIYEAVYSTPAPDRYLSVLDAALDTGTGKHVNLTVGEIDYPGQTISYVVEVKPVFKSLALIAIDTGADDLMAVPPVVSGDNADNDAVFSITGPLPVSDTNIQISVTGMNWPEAGGTGDVKAPNYILFGAWSSGVGSNIAYISKADTADAFPLIYNISSTGSGNNPVAVTSLAEMASHASKICWDDGGGTPANANIYFGGYKSVTIPTVGTFPVLTIFRKAADGSGTASEIPYRSQFVIDATAPWYDPFWVDVSNLPALANPAHNADRIFCSAAGDIRAVLAEPGTNDDRQGFSTHIVITDFKDELVQPAVSDPDYQYKSGYAFHPVVYGSGAALKMAFAFKHPNSWASDIYILKNLNLIFTGAASAPTNLSDPNIIRVTNNGNATYSPSFSPDGSALAYNEDITGNFSFVNFQTNPVTAFSTTNFKIFLQDLTDINTNNDLTDDYARQLIKGNDFNETLSSWSPSGDKILTTYLYGTDSGDEVRLNVLSILSTADFGASGGVLADKGYTRIRVAQGELSNDTKIAIETPVKIANPAGEESWLAHTGIARSFYPTGASFGAEKVFIDITWPDSDSDGYVDGLGLDETKLKMYYWDEGSNDWELVGGTLFTADNFIRVPVTHFSTYALFGQVSAKAGAPFGMEEFYNYPNPAGPLGTTVHFELTHDSQVQVKIYDKTGDLVTELIDETRLAGKNDISWDLTNRDGQSVANGVYIMRARATFKGETKEIINKIAVIR
jgi:flagellar hook assembly protein FlgD/sugar lactone lactonase YvrE